MPENIVKKSFDVSEDDQEFIEKHFVNYAQWLRKKTREEKHEVDVSNHTKTVLLQEIEKIMDKGEELRKQVNEEWEELKEEYDAEIVQKEYEYVSFKVDDEQYTTDWGGQHVEPHKPDQHAPEKAEKFAEKYTSAWQTKIGEHNDYINEETLFNVKNGSESTQVIRGEQLLEDYKLVAKYVVKSMDGIDIHFQDSIDVHIEDLETARELYNYKPSNKGDDQ